MSEKGSVLPEDAAKAGSKTLDDLWAVNKAVADRLEELIHFHRIMLLGEERVFKFLHNDELLQIAVPMADRDFIQRSIVKSGGFFELRQLEMLRSHNVIANGSVIYDVGANIGNHSLYFAKTFKPSKLVSIEPQQQALKLLLKNMELNGLSTDSVVNCMVGSSEGMGDIKSYAPANLGGTAFRETTDGSVRMRTLDSVIAEHSGGKVDFIKIDVEGMHLEALAGAKKTLTEARPLIWIELREFKGEYDSAAEVLAGFGYRQSLKLSAHDFLFVYKG